MTLFTHPFFTRPLTPLLLLLLALALPLRLRAAAPTPALPPVLQGIGIDQHLNTQVPLDLVFRDESNHPVRLAEFVHDKPVILVLAYYQCPMLCGVVLNNLARTLNLMPLSLGQDYTVLTVSFDPHETAALAASKKAGYIQLYRRPGAAASWHFLTGDQPSIDALTRAVGFRYRFDEKSQQFIHPAGITILTPDGRIARYFFGIDYAPLDLRLSLVEASHRQIGGPTDQVLLYCFHYDPATGRYSLAVLRTLRVGAVLILAVLGVFFFIMFRRDRRRTRALAAALPPHGKEPSP